MELKKTKRADLENKRNLFVRLGLVISLGIVLTAFSIGRPVETVSGFGDLTSLGIEDEIIPATFREEIKPPPPPPLPKVFEVLTIVNNNVDIEEEFIFDPTDIDDNLLNNLMPYPRKNEDGEDDHIFSVVEVMPEFPGGEAGLILWIGKNVNYPDIAAKNDLQGRVYIQFVVNTDGSITDARVARGVDPSLDQEALRVINNLPLWKPGMQGGRPVRVSYTVPIKFQLQ